MTRVLLMILVLGVFAVSPAFATPVKVVASMSVLGDLVKQVGGDRVDVTTLVGPNGDTHTYEPKPADVKAIADTDLLVINGLGLEGWMERLRDAAGYKGPVVVASEKVTPLKSEEEGVDPHAWQSVPNAILYVDAIATGLEQTAPDRTAYFQQNADAYKAKLQALDGEVRAAMQPVLPAKRVVITTHDAFGYYGHEYGIRFEAPEGFSTDSEPNARAVADLIQQIRAEKARAVFIENMSDPRLIKQIATEAGVKVGGELYSDALSEPDGPAATYIDMIRHNTSFMVAAMQQ